MEHFKQRSPLTEGGAKTRVHDRFVHGALALSLLLAPLGALAERYQRVERYSLNPRTLGWFDTPQQACDEIEWAFNAGNGANGSFPNHQFLTTYYLSTPDICTVEYHYDNGPGKGITNYGIAKSQECPKESTWVASQNACISNIDQTLAEAAQPASCPRGELAVGNPIYPLRGVKREVVPLGVAIGPVALEFIYDNAPMLQLAGAGPSQLSAPVLGKLWRSSVHRGLVVQSGGLSVQVGRPNGEVSGFEKIGGELVSQTGSGDRIAIDGSTILFWDQGRQLMEVYDLAGVLHKVASPNGSFAVFTYSDASTPALIAPKPGLLISITGNDGRKVEFRYERPGRLKTVVDVSGGGIGIAYDPVLNLAGITWLDGTTRAFAYQESGIYWLLTGIIDESNIRFASFGYDAQGRAVSTEHAGGVDRYTVTYGLAPIKEMAEQYDAGRDALLRKLSWRPVSGVTLTRPNGLNVSGVGAAVVQGRPLMSSNTQPAGSGCAAATSSQSFDTNGNVVQLDDFNQRRSCFTYDQANRMTARVEGLNTSADCASALMGAVPADARKLSSQWHPDWRLATRTAEPRRITTLVYNGQPDPFNGGAVASCAPADAKLPDGKPIAVLCKRVVQATTDETGAQGFAAALQSGVAARATHWTYDANGRVLTETNPLGKVVVSNVYYADTTADHTQGDLQSTANAVNHLTQFPRYNAYGLPLEIVDSNGISTTYAYDARQRLLSTTTQGAVTGYEYWPTGLLKTTMRPDGSFMTYEYDNAHRLVAVADSLGNRIEYTLDQSGNRTQEVAKDPQGTLQRAMSRVYDALGRTQQATGRE